MRKFFDFGPIILILALALSLRLIWLDKVPIGISHDELDYVFNAKSIFLTGKDISGSWSPFSLSTPPHEVPKAELPYLFITPFIGPFNFSLFNARLPFVFYNILLVFVLFLTGKELFNKQVGLIAAMAGAINPWSIYFGRTGYDAPLAALFYLLAFYVVLKSKGWRILLAFPFFFVAFYSYIGTKLFFLPFVMLAVFHAYNKINRKQYAKQYLVLSLLCLSVFVFFLVSQFPDSVQSRSAELFTPLHSSVVQTVDKNRSLAMQEPLLPVFENKLVVYLKEVVVRYFTLFSPQYLFLYGEGDARFSVWYHGMFYYFDAVFLMIGLAALVFKKRKLLPLFIFIFIIAPIPSIASSLGRSFGIRAALAFPFLILVTAFGIYHFFELWTKRWRWFVATVLVAIYALLVANFLHIYFFRNPVFNSEGFNFSSRVLSRYFDLANVHGVRVNIVDATDGLGSLKQYLFYTNKYHRDNAVVFAKNINEGNFGFENINFISCGELQEALSRGQVVIMPSIGCEDAKIGLPNLSIPQLSDGGEIYKIFNEDICSQYRLPRYPSDLKLSDFKVEELSEEKFCQTFITDLNEPAIYDLRNE